MSDFKSQANDWNRKTIEEFRANAGKVGGPLRAHPSSCSTRSEPGRAASASTP